MRILLYGLNFSPELTGIGKYTGEMAEWLARAGHEVCVVTAPPYYPDWRVGEGYIWWWYRKEVVSYKAENPCLSDLFVRRCPVWVPSRPSGLKRLVHLASFALSSLPIMLKRVFWKPDVIWVVEPALLCVPSALLVAWLSGSKCWLHIQDYEVDAAFELGLLKGNSVRRAVLNIERWLMHRFDRVSTISRRMLELAKEKGVADERLVSFPNWVDVKAIAPTAESKASNCVYRQQLQIPHDAVVALYSGNMGLKQGLELLGSVAQLLAGGGGQKNTGTRAASVVFVFCGNGAGRVDLEKRCMGLSNVRFMDLQPLERLGELLGMADIHLLPQKADAADLVMPSKLTGMLASGRPVVATAQSGTELASVVEGCGLVVRPGDAVAMSDAIVTLANNPVLRMRLGEAARAYAEDHLDRDTVLSRFEQNLMLLIDSSGLSDAKIEKGV